ncbi:glycosyltransferase family 2 protein [Caproicibacterium sp. NSD3]
MNAGIYLSALSVIVPGYNSEEKLNSCVESILKQSNPDLELLLINDDSKDRSLEFCHQFERQGSRVTVYDKSLHLME